MSVRFRGFLAVVSIALFAGVSWAQVSSPASQRPNADQQDGFGRKQLNEYLNAIAAKDTAGRDAKVAAITTRAQAEERQRAVRERILKLMGGLPQKTPPHAKIVGVTRVGDVSLEKVLFESQPGFYVTAIFYLPTVEKGKTLPAIVMAPGHGLSGKESDAATAMAFAHNGFAVLSYDPLGQGERLQYFDPATGQSREERPTGEHGEAGVQPTLIGDALARYFAWDGIRAVDYLLTRPEVDGARIGAFGCSGGGTMTALLGALDSRVKAIGVACYTTSFDALLSSIGPQDSEQSTPGFIAAGLDFPDWSELAAPRAYAIIATTSDMFPFAGAQKTEAEARRFYGLFGADAKLQFITGPGGHGNLGPIMPQIIGFFLKNLQPGADFEHPVLPPPRMPGVSPFALPAGITKEALQVTPTGQVATSYPGSETVHSLNLKRAEMLLRGRASVTGNALAVRVRSVTHAIALPGVSRPDVTGSVEPSSPGDSAMIRQIVLHSESGIDLHGELAEPVSGGRHSAVLLLSSAASLKKDAPEHQQLAEQMERLAVAGNVVLAITPRPSPVGTELTKSHNLGPFYITELRSELVGKTLLGMRVDDTLRGVDYLATLPNVEPAHITAEASGHLGLVLIHAAVLDRRLQHVAVDHVLGSYRSLIEAAEPKGAPEDELPGVLLQYDIPDLVSSLGSRLTFSSPLKGSDNLSFNEPALP